MSIIYHRCYAFAKENKMPVASHEHMKQIGKLALDKFISVTGGKRPKLIKAPAYVGNYHVNYYPAFFTEEIDKIIFEFMNGRKQRKRKMISKPPTKVTW